jgi:predicted nucleotidyltransferase component of viral defense system
MKTIPAEQKDLIDALVAEGHAGSLSPFILEKDIHVTDALHALAKLEHAHVHFVFCGGTSLSKAHALIERMSEDVDLKIVLDSNHGLTVSALRKHLSALKEVIRIRMEGLGFENILAEEIARNENQYFSSGWEYQTKYISDSSLRPHLKLEFTVRAPSFPPEHREVGFLIDRLGGRPGASVPMACITVEETLAEKVLSFLRRHAENRADDRGDWDTALTRHVYDTYCIVVACPELVDHASTHFKDLVSLDQGKFTRHREFVDEPHKCMMGSLIMAETEAQTRDEYETVLMPLVYGSMQPSFDEAFAKFKATSIRFLNTLL